MTLPERIAFLVLGLILIAWLYWITSRAQKTLTRAEQVHALIDEAIDRVNAVAERDWQRTRDDTGPIPVVPHQTWIKTASVKDTGPHTTPAGVAMDQWLAHTDRGKHRYRAKDVKF